MDRLVKKLVSTAIGIAICIGIWTVQGRLSGGGNKASDNIPRQVWGGGAGLVTIEAEANQPAVLSASFESAGIPGDNQFMDTWQKIPAGKHSFTIDVPANVHGSVELRVDDPTVGAAIKLSMVRDGRVLSETSRQLDKPLEAGWGFAAGLDVDDYARGEVHEDY